MKTVPFLKFLCASSAIAAHFAFAQEAIEVALAPLSEVAIYPERSAPAEVISLNSPVVSAQVNAQIIEIPIKVGDQVNHGDVLARLDCRDYNYSARRATAIRESSEARFKLATQRFERTEKLVSQRLASDQDLDARRSDLDAARGDFTGAKMGESIALLDQERCTVVAPSNGLVLDRMASVGQLASTGTALIKMIDLEEIEISAQVYADDATRISTEDAIVMRTNGEKYALKIRTILGNINPSTRNREVRLNFLDEQALPGAAGKIFWRDDRPHIPPKYLVRRDSVYGFFISENNVAEFIPLPNAQPGRSNPVENIDVQSLMVVEGHLTLSDGAQISPPKLAAN